MKITNKLFVYDNLFDRGEFKIDVGDIRQISELSIMPGTEIIEHIQHCDEITYAVSGKAKIYSGDICREMRPGQVHFIKTGVRHNIIADENNRFRYVCIGLTPNENNREVGGFMRDFQKKDFFFLQDNGDIRILTELLLNEFYRTDAYSRSMINLYLSQIIILLQRMLKKRRPIRFEVKRTAPKVMIPFIMFCDTLTENISILKAYRRLRTSFHTANVNVKMKMYKNADSKCTILASRF